MQQRCSATEKEAYTVYPSVLKLDLLLKRGKMCITLWSQIVRAILSDGIKIPLLNRWFMKLVHYIIIFVHIRGKNNVLMDATFRLKTLNIYEEQLENPKVQVVNVTSGNLYYQWYCHW